MNETTTRSATRRRLGYTDARTGRPAEADVVAVLGNGERLKLETDEGTVEARLLRAAAIGHTALDNEIMAGLRLHRLLAGRPRTAGPPALIGYRDTGDEPFALVEPWPEEPCGSVKTRLPPSDLLRFERSLLQEVRLLAAAGIAHRALNPRTVRWDGERARITDFAHAAVVGEPRTVVGRPPWSAPEQRPGLVRGVVTDRDDLWAVGRLFLFMATGVEEGEPDPVDVPPDLARLVEGVLADDPAARPDVTELLRRVEADDPVPFGPEPDPALAAGLDEFHRVRESKRERERERRRADGGGMKIDLTPRLVPGAAAPAGRRRRHITPPPLPRPSPPWIWLGASMAALLAIAAYLIAARI